MTFRRYLLIHFHNSARVCSFNLFVLDLFGYKKGEKRFHSMNLKDQMKEMEMLCK